MFSWFRKEEKKRIYLDYAAATPVRPEVLKVMMPFFTKCFGNAGAIHSEGAYVKKVIEDARIRLARILRIRPNGIVFTASGTESNNLVLFGVIEQKRKSGVRYEDMEIVTTKIEHASLMRVCEHLSSLGVAVRYVDVDEEGIVVQQSLRDALTPKTVLVALGYVNSEIGVIQPIGKCARLIKEKEQEFKKSIHFHVDGAQAPLWLPCALDALGANSFALDAGKCYGPKGVGVVAFQEKSALSPHIYGGSQEGGLRAGTENTASIVGAVEALSLAQATHKERAQKVSGLRDSFFELLLKEIEGVIVNGSRESRVANNVHISIPGVESEFAVIVLDEHGIACATKSACGGARGDGSSVVRAISNDPARPLSTIRFTLGEETTLRELQKTVAVLKEHVHATRAILKKLTIT